MKKELSRLSHLKIYLYYTLVLFVILTSFSLFIISNGFRNIKFFTVKSKSMEPNLKPGDFLKVVKKTTYQTGDIITYYRNEEKDSTITHRIINIEKFENQTIYKTKGDNNILEDKETLKEDQIIGTVEFSIPYLGFYFDFLKSSKRYYLLIIVPGFLIIFNELRKILKLKKRT